MNEDNGGDMFGEATRKVVESQTQFAKIWSDFAGRASQAGFAFDPESTPPDGMRQVRSAFLRAWTQLCDEWMRSPEFLNTLKTSMKNAIAFRKQINDSLGRMHHELQGTSRQEIDQIMLELRHLERRLVDAEERNAARLEKILERLGPTDSRTPEGPARKATPRKRAPQKKTTVKKTARKGAGSGTRSTNRKQAR